MKFELTYLAIRVICLTIFIVFSIAATVFFMHEKNKLILNKVCASFQMGGESADKTP